MKHTKKGPCEHFDIGKNCPKIGADCYEGSACRYYGETLSHEDMQNGDVHGPCKRRRDVPDDTQTVEMFKEVL